MRGVQAKMAKRAESEDDASKIAEYAAKKKEGAERKAERFILRKMYSLIANRGTAFAIAVLFKLTPGPGGDYTTITLQPVRRILMERLCCMSMTLTAAEQ